MALCRHAHDQNHADALVLSTHCRYLTYLIAPNTIMSPHTLNPFSVDGGKLSSTVKRSVALMAALSLAAGSVAAQAMDAVATPFDLGRSALALGVLSAIVLVKVWAYADKRSKLMDRLTGYLTSRAAQRSRRALTYKHAQGGAARNDSLGATAASQGLSTATPATSAKSQAAVPVGATPATVIHVLPVPGLPPRMQYLS